MEARVKEDYRWNRLLAFSGHEFIKSEWRKVPTGLEKEAQAHPFLDVRNEAKASKASKVEAPEIQEEE